jgi:hypothetical protein
MMDNIIGSIVELSGKSSFERKMDLIEKVESEVVRSTIDQEIKGLLLKIIRLIKL